MTNFNGELHYSENVKITTDNRAFKYGDGIFETIKVKNGKVVFFEDHYFRLMASMRMLRMKIPMKFTLEFLQSEILKTINVADASEVYRVRLSVFRKDGGLYTPATNNIDYLIEVKGITNTIKDNYVIDVYKDFFNYSGLLSTVKTNNRMLNNLASIYAKENNLDNCILLNESKGVCEVINGNIFVIKGTTIKTPALTEGCIRGIIRNKVIGILTKTNEFSLEETTISPFEVQKADEVFITNSVIGIQPVTKYKKKIFSTEISKKIAKNLTILEITVI